MRIFFIIAFSCLLLMNCQRNVQDKNPPIVTIINPEDESVFSSEGKVLIHATITDNISISEVHVDVTNLNLNQEVIRYTTYPKEQIFQLDTSFITQHRTRYEIAVEAEDQDGNVHREKIHVSALQ